MQKKIKTNQKGTTLIEIVVGIAVVSIVTISLYMALFNVTRLMGDAKQKIGAVALANEQMEIIRNLEYENIGTQGWIPSGPIAQSKTVNQNNFTYVVETIIEYEDDIFDGQGALDTVETDYKKAQVKVSWKWGNETKEVIFSSKFVPDGVETNVGGGTLSVNVIDAAAQPIASATVFVDSVNDTPTIHGSAITDASGNVRLPGLPAQEYKITITKADYASIETYPAPPASAFSPINSNLLVVEGALVIKTLTINKSADLLLKAADIADGDPIEDIDVEIIGGPTIGTSPETLTLDESEETNSSGEINLEDIDSGDYSITNLASLGSSEYEYVGTDTEFPIHLSAEEEKEVTLIFAKKNVNSLIVDVRDGIMNELIEGAEVKVSNLSGFEQTTTTSADGRAYFPVAEETPVVMTEGDYDVEIKATGFFDYSGVREVDDLTSEEFLINPIFE